MKKKLALVSSIFIAGLFVACVTPQPISDPVPITKEVISDGVTDAIESTAEPILTNEPEPTDIPDVTPEPTATPKPTVTLKPACDHTYTGGTCTKLATCETCGAKADKALGHDFEKDERWCSRCGTPNDDFKNYIDWHMEGTTLILSGHGYMDRVINMWSPMPWAEEKIEEVIIEDGIYSVVGLAFTNCSDLKKVTFPKSLVCISVSAFENCSSLEEVVIPGYIEAISDGSFRGCTNLKRFLAPKGCANIGFSTFWECRNLEKVILPSECNLILAQAFTNCKSMTSILIPESVTEIRELAFDGCEKLTTIYGKSGSYAEIFAGDNGYHFVTQ